MSRLTIMPGWNTPRFTFGPVEVGPGLPTRVLAEIGNNHQGRVDIAEQLIDMAAAAGACGVKFQRRSNVTLYSRALLDQPYDNPVSFGPTYGAHRAALELTRDELFYLKGVAHRKPLAFVVTAFDEQAADDCADLGVDAIKIASGGVTDLALIDHVSRLGLPVIISTGGCTEADIVRAHEHCPTACFLHCTASYPCAFDELNLKYIRSLMAALPDNVIGWSSHDNGIAMAVAAAVLGASLIEKHVTLNRAMKGTDHAFSLEREGLRKLCRDLARLHDALGDGVKRYYESEKKPIAKMRRRQTADGLRITGEVD